MKKQPLEIAGVGRGVWIKPSRSWQGIVGVEGKGFMYSSEWIQTTPHAKLLLTLPRSSLSLSVSLTSPPPSSTHHLSTYYPISQFSLMLHIY